MRSMIPGSPAIAGAAIAVSVIAHLGFISTQSAPEAVQLDGSGGAAMVMQGTSFADLAQGLTEPVSANPADPAATAPVVSPVEPRAAAPVRTATTAFASETPAASSSPSGRTSAVTDPLSARAVEAGLVPAVSAGSAIDPVTAVRAEEAEPYNAPTKSKSHGVPSTPVETPLLRPTGPSNPNPSSPVASQSAAIAPTHEDTPPRISLRPATRPAIVEARATAVQDARRQEVEEARAPTPEPPRRAAPQGNAQTNARRGSTTTASASRTTSAGTGSTRASGNAAAANYPGEVQRRIARQRPPRGVGRGTARVSFTVSSGGGLAAISLAASSGNARLDSAAIQLVQAAARFPAPPTGARREFVIPIQSR